MLLICVFLITSCGVFEAPQPTIPNDSPGSKKSLPPLFKVAGPVITLPIKPELPPDVIALELLVSTNRGVIWTLHAENISGQRKVEFRAGTPGEYWFATRRKFADGSLSPHIKDLCPEQRVMVTGVAESDPQANVKLLTEAATELDEELTRLELELIRKEMKRLAEAKEFGPEIGDKIDKLRGRLQETLARLRRDQNKRGGDSSVSPPMSYGAPPPSAQKFTPPAEPKSSNPDLIPPPAIPLPTAPVKP